MKDIAMAGVADESITDKIGTDCERFAAALESGYRSRIRFANAIM